MGDAVRLSFSYPEEMKQELTKLAQKDGRTITSYIKKILNQHIKNILKKKRS